MIGVLSVIIQILLVIFGGIALVVFIYCLLTKKNFKELYPKALEGFVTWVLKELKMRDDDSDAICRMEKTYIEPIIKVLRENGCQCVERNAVIFVAQQIAHYELQLSDKVKELDLSYLEKLVQVVYYNDILPLYSSSGIRKEAIDVFIRREDRVIFVYVGHCPKAYTTINSYREEVLQRELENLNKECQEMIE